MFLTALLQVSMFTHHLMDCLIKYAKVTILNPMAPNDIYMSYRTANLQTLHFKYLLNIYTYEYFKHAAHSPFFSLQNAVYFIMLSFFGSCNIHISNTGCAKILKKILAPKG